MGTGIPGKEQHSLVREESRGEREERSSASWWDDRKEQAQREERRRSVPAEHDEGREMFPSLFLRNDRQQIITAQLKRIPTPDPLQA